MDCIFCQIAAGKVPSDILYRDNEIIAFRDINPQASIHLLIIPREHIPSIAHVSEAQLLLIGRLVKVANQLAKEQGIADSGYRLVVNCGKESGQVVPHLHLHLLGGQRLSDRMG